MSETEKASTPTSPFTVRKISKDGLKITFKLFRYLLPYKGTFIAGLIFLALSTGTSLVFPKLIGSIIEVIEGKSPYTINQITLFLFFILVFQAIFSFFRIYLFTQVSEWSMTDIRSDVFSKIITLPISFLEQRRVGELTSRITSDVGQLQGLLSFTIAELFRQVATLVVGIAILFYTSWKLTLFMLATFPILVVASVFFGRHMRRLSKKAQDELAAANVVAEETLQSVNVVKAFTNEQLESDRYKSILLRVVDLSLYAARFRGGFVSFIIFALFGGIVGVVWYGAGLVQSGEFGLADLFTFILYTTFIGASISGMGDLYAQINKTVGASERLFEILAEPAEIELKNTHPQAKIPIKGEVTYDKVVFSYPSRRDVPVLKGIDIQIPAGEKIALVGYSGAGKSTIIQLLMRFYNTDAGEIRLDGRPISDFGLTDLRNNIAIVPQEVMLFGGSIYENILYGKPGATKEQVYEAARKAYAMEFIDTFPEKLDTLVGERGIKLSGGQRQRIAIARAILKDPKILILDEATSSLDAESEKLVQIALDELMQNRTTIVIAHRLATIRKVDTIYVIREGQIAESGSHQELLSMDNGLYASLIKMQFEDAENLK
ncbi:ABC-type multidrug transport system fused ATPase/permease subunit [Dyadobacter jejuensis]|uniref:ABC-type multidrug transport system fused ATPase/permease subunit n=1 Tax=Dyadobacter jejuensis TaxID=1082580 RepID=A0A316AJE4_9BACT|nr:ABC transporter transmembrane domain-containing protein [Dyadobacter jejuensis]PWJ56990.1 ABC-type multidrug transport system fused ATPase/permease subunit [Dyadobacter jejuensis]